MGSKQHDPSLSIATLVIIAVSDGEAFVPFSRFVAVCQVFFHYYTTLSSILSPCYDPTTTTMLTGVFRVSCCRVKCMTTSYPLNSFFHLSSEHQ